MSKFTSTEDIFDRATAVKYLSTLDASSVLMFLQLPWELNEEGIRALGTGGRFTVLHSTQYGWWEVGYKDHDGSVMVERFSSMEEANAYIVMRWW